MTRQATEQKQKADTGPLTLPPVAPGQLTARRPLPWVWAIVALALVLAVGVAIYLTRQPEPLSDPRPVEVVKGFVAALEAKDASKALGFVVPTDIKKEIGPEVRAYLEYVESLSFSDANYQLVDNDGERAHVRWTATMHYKLNLGSEVKSGDKPVDSVYELIKFEGAWYLQSVAPPDT
jgi:hypothetical protein